MPKVYNWQLGREMEYPYEGKRPKRWQTLPASIGRSVLTSPLTIPIE
jgi:hypothetical protein